MAGAEPLVDRRAAFVALFDAHYSDVLAYARRRLGPDDAEDAVADTFVAAWRNLDRLSGDPLIWLYGLARGMVSNHRRRLQRASRLEERARRVLSRRTTVDPMDFVVWEDSFAAAFAQLSELDREVLRLVGWECLSHAEGAMVLGCTSVAFRLRLHRARQRLARYLQMDMGTSRPARRDDVRDPLTGLGMGTDVNVTEHPSWPPMMPEEHPC